MWEEDLVEVALLTLGEGLLHLLWLEVEGRPLPSWLEVEESVLWLVEEELLLF